MAVSTNHSESKHHKMARRLMGILIAITVLCCFLLYFKGPTFKNSRITTTKEPEIFNVLPDFNLVDQEGMPFSKKDLADKTWIVHTFFTSCPSVCPTLVEEIKKLRNTLEPKIRPAVLSISIDSKRDTPQQLRTFETRHNLDATSNWVLTTGDSTGISALVEKGLMVAMPTNSPDDHSPRIILIDRLAQVRGFYNIAQKKDLELLRGDLGQLN
jgi:protein SCO1